MATFKKILNAIWKWITARWQNLAIVVLLILCMSTCVRYQTMKERYESQIQIVSDSMTEYRNKVGELYAERTINIASIRELKASNTELYEEVKNLKDHPIVVTKVVTETVLQPITVHDTVTIDPEGRYTFPIQYTDDWCMIRGRSSFDADLMMGEAVFDTIAFPDSLWVDLIDKDGTLAFIARSSNPYTRINNLNGAVLSPEKSKALAARFERKWVLSIGCGATATWVDNRFMVVPGLQLTFGRKILSF